MTVPDNVIAELRTAAHAASGEVGDEYLRPGCGERLGITDAFLICSAPSERQINAITDEIELKVKQEHGLASAA
ncbi:RsfS/YbeB/iojap family protein [Nesterenkonia pannonica]|uniref:RsfS/YbeB/iojap family protein n=1 Tax=Nesterenkonia pannonica TaxID=1548602 RepID=UPI00216488A2|nr:RsfS/YbeB/iojap family protein [Nesterenkonia pannonica]